MNALRGLAILLLLQAIGESLTHALSLPFPGPVVGMILLLPALRWPWVRESVSAVAEFLLAHLSLLFFTVGVGVNTQLDHVAAHASAQGRQRCLTLSSCGCTYRRRRSSA
jgi:holin-like protein